MKKKNLISIILVIVVLVGGFLIRNRNVKKQIITADNFDNVVESIRDSLTEDETCYFTYACMKYMLSDGMASALADTGNADAMYTKIYNKTVGELIEEGKQLMKDDNTTVEQYKQALQNMGEDISNSLYE